MRWSYHFFFVYCLSVSSSTFFNNLRDDLLTYFKDVADSKTLRANGNDMVEDGFDVDANDQEQLDKDNNNGRNYEPQTTHSWRIKERLNDIKMAKNKSSIISHAKMKKRTSNWDEEVQGVEESQVNNVASPFIGQQYFHMDPVLNVMRAQAYRRAVEYEDSKSASSSLEMKPWKDEFREHWLHKKYEALNSTLPGGDNVNLVAARPWGVACGDPNQHDMPWGSCMLAMECEAEFRIYRGDYFCGRTRFVCCGIKLTVYDMYQGFDVSFEDKGLSTESDEKKDTGKSSREKRKNKSKKEQRSRKRERENRKKKIKKNIKRIIKEIKKILDKQYKNGTKERKKKTKQLKKFLKELKKQYRKDRQAVQDLHEKEEIKVDARLMHKLSEMQKMNERFVKNETFRDIVVNGTITKQGARMLVEAYPELSEFIKLRRSGQSGRRAGDESDNTLEYDLEYGYVYY